MYWNYYNFEYSFMLFALCDFYLFAFNAYHFNFCLVFLLLNVYIIYAFI